MINIKPEQTQLENKILDIITNEPNISFHLIKATLQQQGTSITNTQLQETLKKLNQENQIQQKTQSLASIKYTSYTIK